ncbi:MAG: Bax inhibitor-1/YccA family protein [Wolbachia endosymbiont of Fragariocoptes setiger]|nr:Bax inhibitor-1/YccA family protein [Wolbachia endosymbiont of Fragariocoptes setiger]
MKNSQAALLDSELAYDSSLKEYMLQIYSYMVFGLLLTGIVAMLTVSSEVMMNTMYTVHDNQITEFTTIGLLISLFPIVIALTLSFGLPRMNVVTARILFWVYSGALGLSLSSVFLVYTGQSIARVFFIAAVIFGGMSLYGYTTKKDLTSLGSFFIMGLFGIVTVSLVNLFLRNTVLDFTLSILGVVIFTVLTAFDTQRIKAIYGKYGVNDEKMSAKVSIICALTLYLDFINIFIHLLRFLGKKR